MRIPSNQYHSVMKFAVEELKELYPLDEIKAMMYWLFEAYLRVDKTQYLLNIKKGMSESVLLKFNFAIKDLKKGKPVQYIIGHSYFHGLKILVNEFTLIPRPETEELVQWVLEEVNHQKHPLKILDMCTGTGCIPLALADKMPGNQYWGADFKKEILDLAKTNAKLNQMKVDFFQFDLLKDDFKKHQEFDIIISNPPYVLESDKQHMHKNVLDFEPDSALFVNDNSALVFYERILDYAELNLKKSGRVYFEIHESKSEHIKSLFTNRNYSNIKFRNDFRGKIRFVRAEK